MRKLRNVVFAAGATVALTGAALGFTTGVASAATTNPCGGSAVVYDQGNPVVKNTVWGGYTYTWDQGWLIIWDSGHPYTAYYPQWSPWGC